MDSPFLYAENHAAAAWLPVHKKPPGGSDRALGGLTFCGLN